MNLYEISARKVAIGLIGGLIATNIFVLCAHTTGWWSFKLALFICLSFLPGVALLRALRIRTRTFSAGVLYSFGLGILVIMLSGLAANQILYMLGVQKPLELAGALGAWNIVTALLIVGSICINKLPVHIKPWRAKAFPKSAWLLAALSLLLPCLAALGAFRLNNGGDALLAMLTLGFVAVLIVYAILLRRRLPNELLVWLIFIIGLSVLLMTSLRGWDIVGHDIEREFRVFTLTHQYGHWDIALDRNPYNACLSITILPEMFARILDVSGLTVFKVILQIIFAACPAVLYLLLRQHVSKLGALAGSLLFICYPTFINDSAMLTRQSVAYLFFALALLVISNKTQKKRYKVLFLLCALGAILSHYSTAYMFVGLFAIAVVCKMCISWWLRRRHAPNPHAQRTIVSPLFASLLFLMTFIWYTQITATSSGLITTLQQSIANIPKLFSDDNKSSDTSTALLFAGGKTQSDLYQAYLADSDANNAPGAASATEYIPSLTSDDMPITRLGEQARSIGIDPSFVTALRQNFAKVLQVLALAGVMCVAYRLLFKKPNAVEPNFVYLSFAGIVVLTLMVILPVLSINYGILRAFQQNLIFLILPIMILLARMGQYLWPKVRTYVATSGIVLLFLVFSGFVAQILGGASPTLSMNNHGLYYGLYYSPEADLQAFRWLRAHIPKNSDVRAANFNKAFMHDPDYTFSRAGILPSQINVDSYVYLDQAQLIAQKLYTYYENSPLILEFPLDYYDRAKNRIYSTASTRVYR
jgi:uncharacterized membrane protein